MKPGSDDVQVACSLSVPELRERETALLARFRSSVIETEELPNGYSFRGPGDGKWIAIVAELIAVERVCCPFLTFELAAQPNLGPVIVRVFGPSGAKDFVRTILCKPDGSA